jgi:hypothetical protein
MSNKRNVQGAIAQAMLNRRVFRDLKMAMDRTATPRDVDELKELISESNTTPEEIGKTMIDSLQEAVDKAMVKIKLKMQQDVEKAKKMLAQV